MGYLGGLLDIARYLEKSSRFLWKYSLQLSTMIVDGARIKWAISASCKFIIQALAGPMKEGVSSSTSCRFSAKVHTRASRWVARASSLAPVRLLDYELGPRWVAMGSCDVLPVWLSSQKLMLQELGPSLDYEGTAGLGASCWIMDGAPWVACLTQPHQPHTYTPHVRVHASRAHV